MKQSNKLVGSQTLATRHHSEWFLAGNVSHKQVVDFITSTGTYRESGYALTIDIWRGV